MDYEKKYKNALEWARQVMDGETGFIRKEVEEVFPELKESEDERIRKKLISFVENWKNRDYNSSFEDFPIFTSNSDECDRILAWLEKQGEQKSQRMISAEAKEALYDKPTAWSEEDEKNWRGVIDEIEANKSSAPDYDVKTYDRFSSWLKSLKQRFEKQGEQKIAWNEEEEQGYEDVDWCINKALRACNNEDETGTCWFAQRWINSIKQRLGGGK